MLAESEENANQGFTGMYPKENPAPIHEEPTLYLHGGGPSTSTPATSTSSVVAGTAIVVTPSTSLQSQGENSAASNPYPRDSSESRRGTRGWPRGRRRKRPRDFNAPKHPLTGYLRFLNDNREKIRLDNPNASFSEVTKILAGDWSKLPTSDKQQYLELAEKDKERYVKELEEYQQTEAYRVFTLRKQQEKKRRVQEYPEPYPQSYSTATTIPADRMVSTGAYNPPGGNLQDPVIPETGQDNMPTYDIPIFTDQFLDHNKNREAELRQLKKSTTEYEEQNAVLSKHMEQLRSVVSCLEEELVFQESLSEQLQDHLDTLAFKLANTFCQLPLPSTNQVATLDTITDYMNQLHNLVLDAPPEDPFVSTVKNLILQLDYPPLPIPQEPVPAPVAPPIQQAPPPVPVPCQEEQPT